MAKETGAGDFIQNGERQSAQIKGGNIAGDSQGDASFGKQQVKTNHMYHHMAELSPVQVKLGAKIGEGKTKSVYLIQGHPDVVVLKSKDDITAGNNARHDVIAGKGAACNWLTCSVFELLRFAGIETHYIRKLDETSFVARNLTMIPLEIVIRRIATGSFLKRNPGVTEGFVFEKPLIETCLKDDEQGDPILSDAQILSGVVDKFAASMSQNNATENGSKQTVGLSVSAKALSLMKRAAEAVFEILELAWKSQNCTLVDMKVEFGVDQRTGKIYLGDVIDNDSWRLWPNGDPAQMKDKQVYRNAKTVTPEVLAGVLENYQLVNVMFGAACPSIAYNETAALRSNDANAKRVLVILGSRADMEFAKEKVVKHLRSYGIDPIVRACSAHKATREVLELLYETDIASNVGVVIAIAGRSNGLGPVISSNCDVPVINCPPDSDMKDKDVWSSLHMPSGVGCTTAYTGDCAALAAAKIIGQSDYLVRIGLRGKRFEALSNILYD